MSTLIPVYRAKKSTGKKPIETLSDLEKAIITHYLLSKHESYKKTAEQLLNTILHDYVFEEPLSALDAKQFKLFDSTAFPFHGPEPGTEKFTFVDLFAGIGGFRIAMQAHGGRCLFSSEWDKYSQQTYYANYGEVPFGDITKEEVKRFIPEKFDVLCAGFPCQPFSRAGVSARNYLGLEHGFDHPTQGNLFFEIISIAKKFRPKVLFLENVKNLRSHDGGNTFKTIESMIREIGYSFEYKIINAETVVPQRRERTYIVCFSNQNIEFEFPRFIGTPLKLKSILEPQVAEKYTISDKLWQGHQRRTKSNLERGTGFTAFLADLERPSNTIVARYGKDGKECLIPQIGANPRKLTPRECARLQGFPENFILPKSDAAAYRQFGNSVAVPVITEIANAIYSKLNSIKVGIQNIS